MNAYSFAQCSLEIRYQFQCSSSSFDYRFFFHEANDKFIIIFFLHSTEHEHRKQKIFHMCHRNEEMEQQQKVIIILTKNLVHIIIEWFYC